MRNRSWGISEYPVFGQTLQCAMLEALYQETFQSVKATWQWKLPLGSEYVSIWPPNGNVNIDNYDYIIRGLRGTLFQDKPISVARIQWCSLFGSQCWTPQRSQVFLVTKVLGRSQLAMEATLLGVTWMKWWCTCHPWKVIDLGWFWSKLDTPGQIYPLDIQHSYGTSPSLIQR